MKEKHIQPGIYIFASMLKVCANTNDRIAGLRVAEDIVNEMKKAQMRPNNFTLAPCLRMHLHHRNDIRPKKWIKWMLEVRETHVNTRRLHHRNKKLVQQILNESQYHDGM
mmetsp:Transcript_21556/g.52784  ORF Transcript_21556/g.52784 Transcript_21556/m.52784 type:complete len:110 (+) Transcript_21556:1-330(+)